MNNIGLEIKELREYLGLSQSQLAKISGLTPAALSQIEADKREPSLSSIEKICTALDIEPSYLFRNKAATETGRAILMDTRLTKSDLKEVEKFMQFLAHKKKDTP